MYFTKYEDVPVIYFIDKKVQPGYQKPRIILGKGRFAEEVFDGTLIEGEMVKDTNGHWLFLINDVIAYKNQYLSKIPLPKRLVFAYEMLDEYVPDPFFDVCSFQVKQYCYASNEGLEFLLELADQLPYTNRGIYYWPFFMQYKPKLYNFDESVIKEVVRKVKDNPEFRETLPTEPDTPSLSPSPSRKPMMTPPPLVPSTSCNEGEKVMWLRKTELPDVYDVYESQVIQSKAGVAHIGSLAVSKKLRNVFKDLTVAVSVPFVCKWSDPFKKYEPISQAS
jgi:hypothetical protein